MPLPPPMSEDDRRRALEEAKRARARRATVKEQVRRGELKISELFELAQNDSAIAKMRTVELLESIPGYGKVRAQSLMERVGISPTRRIMGLGKVQRAALIAEFHLPAPLAQGSLLVLSGPGGVGKSTVTKRLKEIPGFWVSVSATTRAPRFNEVDGVDYFFYSNEEFDSAVENGEFLEWAEFAGNRYGTPSSPVSKALAEGTHVLLEIEIAGARQVKERAPHAHLIFLEPPSWEELVSRLEGRGTDSPERRAARLALAQEELAAASFFDTVIINDEVEKVVAALISLAS
jgi:guanylate kinase